MNIIIVALVLIIILNEVIKDIKYQKTDYYKQTKNKYIITRNNKGLYGEYLIYDKLKDLQQSGGKFLFNTYLNKNSKETTEIDVMLIHKCGIFVFESKNYSGWIFGNSQDNYWTQTLPTKKGKSQKEHFYNPIKQNQTHIKALRKQIGEITPIYSVIVFSDKCKLKKITNITQDTHIIKTNELYHTVTKILNNNLQLLSETEIENLYNNLYPYTQVSKDIKQKHIENIKKRII
jgi:hypothetical protein